MNRIFLACVVASVATSQSYAEECSLKRLAVIPFAVDETSHIVLPVSLDGRQTKFMLDTGAYWSMINQEVVDALGLKTKRSVYLDMKDLAGNKIDKVAMVPDVRVGNLHFGTMEFFVGAKSGVPMEEDGGLVGQNFLTQMDIEIDNAGRKITFFSQDHCPGGAGVVHWADEAVTLEYAREKAYQPLGTRTRQQIDKNQIDPPIVKADLEGEPVKVLFDTGATYSAMDLSLAKRRFGIDKDTPGVTPGGKALIASGEVVDSLKYTFKSLSIAGIRFENVPIRLIEFKDPSMMLLGMNEMKKLRLYFSFKEGLIHVTAADARRQPTPAK